MRLADARLHLLWRKTLRQMDLRGRLMWLAMLPVLVFALVWGVYVIRQRAADLAPLLQDANTHIYVCGLKSMEEGVLLALRDVAQGAGLAWDELGARLKREGRLHLETY